MCGYYHIQGIEQAIEQRKPMMGVLVSRADGDQPSGIFLKNSMFLKNMIADDKKVMTADTKCANGMGKQTDDKSFPHCKK